jgi:hypothetical protein
MGLITTNMKTLLILFLPALMLMSFTQTNRIDDLQKITNTTFLTGEQMSFKLHYGFINAGQAEFKVKPYLVRYNKKECYKIEVKGKTSSAMNLIVKVEDKWSSIIDKETLYPQVFHRDIREGKYRLKENTYFNYEENKVKVEYSKKDNKVKKREFETEKRVHDIISGYYYLRNIDFSTMEKYQVVGLDAFLENEFYDIKVRYLGTETIKLPIGKVSAIKLEPVMPDNDLFEGENSVCIWISNDKNRIPLKASADMFVGAVEMDITDYSGLRHPLNIVD